MPNNIFIEINEVEDIGLDGVDVTVSDDFDTAPTVFIDTPSLQAMGGVKAGRAATDPTRRDVCALACWLLLNTDKAADIIWAAINNNQDIESSWDTLHISDLAKRMASMEAEKTERQLDENTGPALGSSRIPRI